MDSPRKRPLVPTPLVPAALLLAAGIATGRYAPLPLGAWAALLVSLLIAATALHLRRHLRIATTALLAGAIFTAGVCLGLLGCHRVPADHVVAFVPARSAPLAEVTGQVVTAPETDPTRREPFAAYVMPPRTRFLLAAEEIATSAGPARCRGLLRVAVNGPVWGLRPGQRVRIVGRLSRPAGPGNPGQYDRRAAARRSGVLVGLSAEHAEAVTTIGDGPSRLGAWLWRFRAQARQHLQADSRYQGRLLLRAMVLGQRHRGLDSINQAMIRAGVAHFLSISGLHLCVLLGCLYLLMRVVRIPPHRSAWVVLVLLGLYLLVAEPRTPLLRASIMAAAFCVAVILGRSASTANLLAAAAIILLVAEPMELFRPGFQLSFGIVAGILILCRPVRELLFGRWLRRRGLVVFRDEDRVRRWLAYNAFDWLSWTVAISVSAYLAALPLVAHHFGLFTPLAPIMTLVMFPLVAVTLIAGYVQMLLAWPMPNLSAAMAPLLGGLTDALGALAEAMGRIPWVCIELLPVPVWATVLLAAVIVATACRARLRLSRAWACVLLAGATTTVVLLTQLPAAADGEATLSVLDVRHGNCVALRTPSGATFLLDAGSSSVPDLDAALLQPFFRDRRWPDPTAAFVSHPNIDHYNALPALLARHRLPQVFLHETFEAPRAEADKAPALMALFERAGTRLRRLCRGQQVRLDDRTTVTVLWPPPPGPATAGLSVNDSSLVLRVDCDGTRVLLPGDIGARAQLQLLALPQEPLRADVLILPHHGSTTPALPDFIAAVDPRLVIRSSAPRRSGATQSIPDLTLSRHFFATDRDGCITVRFTPDGPEIREIRGQIP